MLLDSNYEKVWVPTRYSSCISNIKLTGGTKKALGVKTDNCVKKVGVEGEGNEFKSFETLKISLKFFCTLALKIYSSFSTIFLSSIFY